MNAKLKRVSDAALAVLSGMTVQGQIATITAGQLDRKLYVEVNEALVAIGGTWNRKAKGHIFEGDPTQAIDDLIDAGGFVDRVKGFEFYPTPTALAARVVEAAGVRAGMLVLEPSAGDGALVRALPAGCSTVAVELDLAHRPALEGVVHGLLALGVDFLSFEPSRIRPVDAVVMNPPFSRGQDVAHVTHALGFLRPGGRLAAIMSAGVEWRQDRRSTAFRELVAAHDGAIERLPDGSFLGAGTGVRTVLVTMTRGGARG